MNALWRFVWACRAFLETLGGAPVFDPANDDEPMSDYQIACLMVLHAEAVHGCEHTGDIRAELHLSGPRGRSTQSSHHERASSTPHYSDAGKAGGSVAR